MKNSVNKNVYSKLSKRSFKFGSIKKSKFGSFKKSKFGLLNSSSFISVSPNDCWRVSWCVCASWFDELARLHMRQEIPLKMQASFCRHTPRKPLTFRFLFFIQPFLRCRSASFFLSFPILTFSIRPCCC